MKQETSEGIGDFQQLPPAILKSVSMATGLSRPSWLHHSHNPEDSLGRTEVVLVTTKEIRVSVLGHLVLMKY